jgi:hypothetical protein
MTYYVAIIIYYSYIQISTHPNEIEGEKYRDHLSPTNIKFKWTETNSKLIACSEITCGLSSFPACPEYKKRTKILIVKSD